MNRHFRKGKVRVSERCEGGYNGRRRHKKTCQAAGFLSEHPARRNVFKGFAVVFKHAFEDFTQFHGVLRFYSFWLACCFRSII